MGEQCDGRVDAIFLFTLKLAIRLSVAFVFAQRFLLPFFFSLVGCLCCDNFATCLACNGSEKRYVGGHSLDFA